MRVKLFSFKKHLGNREKNLQKWEDTINQWLLQNDGIEVVEIKQSASGGSMGPSLWLISIWYDDSNSE